MPTPSITVLAGDVGGTKTFLALAHIDSGRLIIEREARYATGDYAALTPMIQTFLAGAKPAAACFGIASAITARRVKLTNREFWIDADEIAHEYSMTSVRLHRLWLERTGFKRFGNATDRRADIPSATRFNRRWNGLRCSHAGVARHAL
jgi:hypothetical protein